METTRTANAFDDKLAQHGLLPLRARAITTLQVNLGKLCNQACQHCHVDSGPHQTSADVNMGAAVADRVIELLRGGEIETVDLTGGAPELNPHFRQMVAAARTAGVHVIDRCNLSVLFEPGQEDLATFLAEHEVEVVASLPFYRQDRTDRQRGAGVFDSSILGLQRLNALRYGDGTSGRVLNLVYNPVGAYLPAAQDELEADYKAALQRDHGIVFDRLFCITNMPIARFGEWLQRSGNTQSYRQALLDAFNPSAVDGVMCRHLVSVGPRGTIYDCDFNQMLQLPVAAHGARDIRDTEVSALAPRAIVTGAHCLGCTAGAGSSCGGTTA